MKSSTFYEIVNCKFLLKNSKCTFNKHFMIFFNSDITECEIKPIKDNAKYNKSL